MNLLKKIKQRAFRRSVDIIEWIVHAPKCTLWRYSPNYAYFENGTRLRVREGQMAVLVNEGRFADVYQPGEYELTVKNMPILSTIKGWKLNFNAPFKIDVYFINTKHFEGMSWATSNSILIDDTRFGPIHITAYGSYSFRVENNPIVYIKNVAGSGNHFTTNGIAEQLRRFVVTKFTDYLVEFNIGALELKTELKELSNDFTYAMKEDFSDYGIELTQFVIEKVTLPKVVDAALSKETTKRNIGNIETYTVMNFDDMFKGATIN